MVYTGHVKPVNKIVAAGKPLVQELEVEVATTMLPGRLVMRGTGDHDVVVSTSTDGDNIVGWLGYEQTAPAFRPSTPDTIYVAGDEAAVLSGGHFIIVASLASGQSVAKDDALIGVAAGEVGAATVANDNVVCFAEETVDATSAAKDIMVRSMI